MKFYYGLSEEYDDKYECEDYIAYLYEVKYIDEKRDIYEPNRNSEEDYFVSATSKRHDNTVAKNEFKVRGNNFKMLPILHQNTKNSKNIQRDVVVITASSGSGKTTLIRNMTKVYRGLNPQNRVIFVSSKNMKKDPSFDHKLFEFISFDDFMENFDDEAISAFETNNVMDNSLLIFDDIVLSSKTREGKIIKDRFYKFLSIVLNLKRMNYLSLIFCCHETSDGHYTRLLFNEMTIYITFNTDLKNRSNLIMKDYLKMSKEEIDKMISSGNTSRWNAVLTRPRCVLTENEIFALL